MPQDLEFLSRCGLCDAPDLSPVPGSPHVHRCLKCGFTFHNPRPTSAAIARYYSSSGKYDAWLVQLAARRRMWRRRIRLIRRHVRSGRLLDVGAGIGELMLAARPHFEVTGTEVSLEAVRVASEGLRVDLVPGTLDECRFEGKFDVITLIHVLEHVPQPLATLQRCASLMRPGGILFVAVPNDSPLGWYKARNGGRRALSQILRGRARGMEYQATSPFPRIDLDEASPDDELHLSHFSPESLMAAMRRAGLLPCALGLDPYFASSGLQERWDVLERGFWRVIYALTGLHAYEAMFAVGRKI